jgi:hypothetical protein
MTISSEDRSTAPFSGNGAATIFPFAFKVFAKSDLVVVKTNVDLVDTTLTLDSDYSVALNADQDNSPGGTITYPISGSPLATGEKLIAYGDIAFLQPTDIVNQSGFYPRVIEDALDRLTMLIQQVFGLARRAIRVPVSAVATSTELPDIEGRANKIIAFDADGNVIVSNKTLGEVESDTDIRQGTRTTQQYIATAGQTFVDTLYNFVPGANQIAVSINGALMTPGVDYVETDQNTVTFTNPLQAGDAVQVELFGRTINFVDEANVGVNGGTLADFLDTLVKQSSATDTTPGRLMAVGAFGLGSAVAIPVTSPDFNTLLNTGVYAVGGTSTNGPNTAVGTLFVWGNNSTSGRTVQHYVTHLSGDYYFRAMSIGVWGDWQKVAVTASPAFTGTPTAPTPTIGDNSTKIATTAFVAANAGGGLGYGQTWQNMTGSRALATTYTNSTGKPIQLIVGCSSSVAAGVLLSINGGTGIQGTASSAGNSITAPNAIIPSGATYAVTITGGSASSLSWWELR